MEQVRPGSIWGYFIHDTESSGPFQFHSVWPCLFFPGIFRQLCVARLMDFDPTSTFVSTMATTAKTPSRNPKAKKLNKQQAERRRESRRAASARHRERHRELVLQAGRERAVRRRAHLKTLQPGDEVLEDARAKAREASARYRERNANEVRNREELALQQRQVRKRAYIKKHGIYAHIQRRFDAPIAVPESDSESEGGEDDLSWGPIGYDAMAAPLICDYVDPCLRR
ncbi:hypothetical protein B0H14DRAFT_2651618 [Mycena olivaceomarginata]|nr:hypothetical protein B0H14DRAFT_2651618 [Mycena olivaceomarginata]